MLLNTQWNTEEIKENFKKYLKTNENKSTTIQNLWHTSKSLLRGKFIAIKTYLRKQETYQINSLNLHLNQLENEERKIKRLNKKTETKK